MDGAGKAGKRLLLVCEYFPPENIVAANRTGAFARDLTKLGWEVRVLCPRPPGTPPAAKIHVTVLPESRLSRAVTARRSRETSSDLGNSGPKPWRVFLTSARRAFRTFIAFPDREVIHWLPWKSYQKLFGAWVPDIILASGPPFSVFLTAKSLAATWERPWVADYRDLWTNGGYYEFRGIRLRAERALENWLARSATALVTVSRPLAGDLGQLAGREVHEILNGYESEDFPDIPDVAASPGPLNIVYTGEIYPDRRDPKALFEAVAKLGMDPSQIAIHFHGDSVEYVRTLAASYGLSPLVHFGPRVPRRESIELQRKADVLLLLMWNDPREEGVYSAKIFEYAASRRPVLMLGFDRGVAAALVRDRKLGWVENSPERIKPILEALVEEKARRNRIEVPLGHNPEGLSRWEQDVILSRILSDAIKQNDVSA